VWNHPTGNCFYKLGDDSALRISVVEATSLREGDAIESISEISMLRIDFK